MKPLNPIAIPFLLALVAGCSGTANVPVPEASRTVVFEPGAPNFDMEAVAVFDGVGQTGVDIISAIPHASLVFLNRGDRYAAGYELLVRVRPQGSRSVEADTAFTDTVVTTSYDSTVSQNRIYRRDRINLPSGAYTLELSLEDLQSGARAVRKQHVEISDAARGESLLSEIRLKVSRFGGNLVPAVSLHLPTGYDSLMASADLYNLPEEAEAILTLIRFQSDTSVASPPYYFTPGPFSMPYIGVDYNHGDTVQVSRRPLSDVDDHVTIEFLLPELERGSYLAKLNVTGASLEHESVRYFSIMREGFPEIRELDEMIEALRYIAREDEWAQMMRAGSMEDKKHRFDAFWAGIVPNKEAAAALLETYYSRVEEANVIFSNHKEGWKTDRGMVYIVFGAPAHMEEHHLRKDWFYYEQGFPLSRRLPAFIFKRSTPYGLGGLFDNYVLQRTPEYEDEWRRKIEKWRDGVSM